MATSFAAALFLLCTAAFGTGVLALPFALVHSSSLFVGFAFFFLAAGLSGVSNLYLARLADYYRCPARPIQSYGDLVATVVQTRQGGGSRKTAKVAEAGMAESLLGQEGDGQSWGLSLRDRLLTCSFDLLMCTYTLGAVINYLMFLSEFITALLRFFGAAVPRWELICALSILVLPFCMVQKITELKGLSAASMACLPLVCCAVLYKAAMYSATIADSDLGRLPETLSPPPLASGMMGTLSALLNSFAIIFFSSVNQCCTIPIFASLRSDKDSAAQQRLLSVSFAIVLGGIYLLVALSAVYQYGLDTRANFLSNFPTDDHLIIVCRLLLVCMLLLAIILNIFPSMQSLFRIIATLSGNTQEPLSFPARLAVTASSLGFCTLVACSTTDIAGVIGVTSSLFASVLALGVPGLLHMAMLNDTAKAEKFKNPESKISTFSPCAWVLCGVTAVLWANTILPHLQGAR